MATPSIHSGHRRRLRARALNTQMTNMPPHEVLEFLLTYVIPVRDVNVPAHLLLNHFGSLKNVFHADPKELAKVPGIGKVTAEYLVLLGKVLDEYISYTEEERPVYSKAVQMIPILKEHVHEPGYYVICLNAQSNFQRVVMLEPGNYDLEAMVALILRAALQHDSYNVTLVHHGSESFSALDLQVYRDFPTMTRGLDVLLMDILYLTDTGRISSLRAKLMEPSRVSFRDPDYHPGATSEEVYPDWLDDWRPHP